MEKLTKILLYIVLIYVGCVALRKYFCFWCKSKVCLIGKTALITGGASGIGYQIALSLAARGCRVIIADIANVAKSAQDIIRKSHNPNIIGKQVDLQSFKSVRALASFVLETEPRLDILINNAGIGNIDLTYTQDGLQRTMQVNYFSHFLLTHLLIDLLKKSSPSRIIFTSSSIAFLSNLDPEKLNPKASEITLKDVFRGGPYGASKLCQAVAAKMFSERLKGTEVTANVFHPGGVRTNIFYKAVRERFSILILVIGLITWSYGKSPEGGAQTALYLAESDEVKTVSGKFFIEGRKFFHPLKLRNNAFCKKIWDLSIEYTKLKPEEIKC